MCLQVANRSCGEAVWPTFGPHCLATHRRLHCQEWKKPCRSATCMACVWCARLGSNQQPLPSESDGDCSRPWQASIAWWSHRMRCGMELSASFRTLSPYAMELKRIVSSPGRHKTPLFVTGSPGTFCRLGACRRSGLFMPPADGHHRRHAHIAASVQRAAIGSAARSGSLRTPCEGASPSQRRRPARSF